MITAPPRGTKQVTGAPADWDFSIASGVSLPRRCVPDSRRGECECQALEKLDGRLNVMHAGFESPWSEPGDLQTLIYANRKILVPRY